MRWTEEPWEEQVKGPSRVDWIALALGVAFLVGLLAPWDSLPWGVK